MVWRDISFELELFCTASHISHLRGPGSRIPFNVRTELKAMWLFFNVTRSGFVIQEVRCFVILFCPQTGMFWTAANDGCVYFLFFGFFVENYAELLQTVWTAESEDANKPCSEGTLPVFFLFFVFRYSLQRHEEFSAKPLILSRCFKKCPWLFVWFFDDDHSFTYPRRSQFLFLSFITFTRFSSQNPASTEDFFITWRWGKTDALKVF